MVHVVLVGCLLCRRSKKIFKKRFSKKIFYKNNFRARAIRCAKENRGEDFKFQGRALSSAGPEIFLHGLFQLGAV
jgi:hypothetical protein